MRTEGQADGRTDMTKLTVAFRNFAKAPKNGSFTDHSTKSTIQVKQPVWDEISESDISWDGPTRLAES